MLNEEILYLERVNNLIDTQLEHDKVQLEHYMEEIKIIPDDDENKFSMTEKWIDLYLASIASLKRHKDKPYFARIDFKDETRQNKDKLYIGKLSMMDDNNDCVVIDWRTPVANLYYDSSLGNTSYKTNDGSYIHGDLSLKRVYTIENSKLLDYLDVHSTSDDELLKPFLGVNADNKIKNIVSSIQKEQNDIIRDSLYKNIVVQGVAGSGKTTVMLHRIAYLAYNYQDLFTTTQYLVLSPNNLFTDYISAILPDLEVDKVKQATFENIFTEYLNFKFKPNLLTRNKSNDYDYISEYKSGKEMISKIDRFYKEYESKIIDRDITYKDIVIISKEDIRNTFTKNNTDPFEIKLKKLINDLYSLTQKDSFRLIGNINNQIKVLTNKDLTKRKEYLDIAYEAKQLFIKGMKELIKNHFKVFDNNIYKLYIEFVNTIENDIVRESTINNLNNKRFDYDDLPLLIYLKFLINGAKSYDSYISISIDEAQDLGYTHFIALKKIFRRAYFTIVGDLSQSIYAYRGIRHWDDINELFANDILYLSKSYRNTIEIMEYANKILEYLNVSKATPVIRHGDNVNEIKYTNKVSTILDRVSKYKENHNSIDIICKTKEEVDILYKELSKKIEISKIDENTLKYEGGLCILPIYLSKGLEFDCVILSDVDNQNYNKDNILDMKLLYVGITRALHNLDVLYTKEKQELYK